MNIINQQVDNFTGDYEILHPMLLVSKANVSDNQNYHQEVNKSDVESCLEAMDFEYNILHHKMKAWDKLQMQTLS